ncbi:Ppx/GppA phosphatase family protein [Candidatus Protochlamydia phocaeensis]|uniref:Ppx/GppA phosphatase family protein n=1 Tax=Candidatus Protochlamydia phocaeensis TaxID=1414722 RepID=UPI0008388647|nr:diol dehydratase reactivase ATPase-like domain-containing protein [Candidatus Protochlamydia phocaeensis]
MDRRFIWISLIILAVILLVVWVPRYEAQSQGEIRAALDIGSGATNLKVAKVDPKTNKIISKIFEQSIPVAYQKHLEQSGNNTFDEDIMNQGIRAIKALKEIADSYHAKKVVAVATAAFRQAANAQQFAQEVERKTGVQVRIINQDEEGILAFRGALAVTPAQPEHTVVWDIGGGSMQLTALTESGTYLVDKGKTASIPFKNAIIQNIEHKDLKVTQTPNPMNQEEIEAALQLAGEAASEANPFIKDKLQEPKTEVLAVGSLFNYGVRPLVNENTIKQDQLRTAVMKLAGKSDAELPGGSLAEVAVSNPLLVLGYMQALHINQVDVVSINNADGALTYPAYWQ